MTTKMTFKELTIDIIKRITSREFIGFLLFIIYYIPKLVPSLPANQQEIAITAGTIATIAFALIRTFGKISEQQTEKDIEKAKGDVEMLQATLQQAKNYKDIIYQNGLEKLIKPGEKNIEQITEQTITESPTI